MWSCASRGASSPASFFPFSSISFVRRRCHSRLRGHSSFLPRRHFSFSPSLCPCPSLCPRPFPSPRLFRPHSFLRLYRRLCQWLPPCRPQEGSPLLLGLSPPWPPPPLRHSCALPRHF